MGLVSTYVSYRIGKSRGERKSRQSRAWALECLDERCDDYHYCVASGSCNGQCTYENLDDE